MCSFNICIIYNMHLKYSFKTKSNIISQRTIEFDLTDDYTSSNSQVKNVDLSFEVRKGAERVKNIKRNYEQMHELNLNNRERQINIEDLENQPAYMRKKIQIDNAKPSEEVKISRYSLTDDEEDGGVKLSNNIRYLHENVD